MIQTKTYLVPSAEPLEFQPDGLLLASPGDISDNGTEIGTVVDSGWDGWDNN
jgi:hypothetical protein